MSKKITLSLIVGLILTLLVSGIAFANEENPNSEHGGRGRLAYGEVVSVGDATFTLQNLKGEEVTFSVDADTKFRAQGEEAISFANVEIGKKVAVTANKDSVAKLVILLPDDFQPGERFSVRKRGEIATVDAEAGTFSLLTPNGEELTFTVDEDTHYKGQLTSLDEMQTGWNAGVAAKEQEDGTLLATFIIAGERQERPEIVKARGTVASVDAGAGTFTITTQDGESLTFTVDESTRYKGQLTSLDEMQTGWNAGVAAKEQEDGTLLALIVIAGDVEAGQFTKARGTITSVNARAGTFTLTTQDGQNMIFTVSEKTRYKGQLSSLDEMQTGWNAGVAAKEQEDGTLLAVLIIARERSAQHPTVQNPHTP